MYIAALEYFPLHAWWLIIEMTYSMTEMDFQISSNLQFWKMNASGWGICNSSIP